MALLWLAIAFWCALTAASYARFAARYLPRALSQPFLSKVPNLGVDLSMSISAHVVPMLQIFVSFSFFSFFRASAFLRSAASSERLLGQLSCGSRSPWTCSWPWLKPTSCGLGSYPCSVHS